jgi:Protein of unknown function (DUF2695)
MDDVAIDEQLVQLMQRMAKRLTQPRTGECLVCYVGRMLDEFGCDTSLRFARNFRDQVAPRATGLERRLGNMGGFCDCEIFLNGMRLAPHLRTYGADGEEVAAELLPACAGVRRGSTQACAHWVRRRRGGYEEW